MRQSISNERRCILFLERILLLIVIQLYNLWCIGRQQQNQFIFIKDILNSEWCFLFFIVNIIIGLTRIEKGRYLECFITFFSFWFLTGLLVLFGYNILFSSETILYSTITYLLLFIYLFYKKI